MDFKHWIETAALDQGVSNLPPPPIEDSGDGEDGDEWATQHWDEIRKWGNTSSDAQNVRNLAFTTLFEQPPKLIIHKYGVQVQLDAQWKISTKSRKWNELMQESQKILQYSDLWKYLRFSKHLSLDATEIIFGAVHFRYAWNDSDKDYGTTHAKFNINYILRKHPEYEIKIKERLLEHERKKWEKRNQHRGSFSLRPFPYTIQNIELEFRGIDGQAQMMSWDYFWGRAVAMWNYRGLK